MGQDFYKFSIDKLRYILLNTKPKLGRVLSSY